MTTIDLSGGVNPSNEYGIRDPRSLDEDNMRDSVSVWLYDDDGRFGFPRLALEASGPNWDTKRLQVSVAFPNGRVLDASGEAPSRHSEDEAGNLSIFAAGGLEFRCLEPLKHWRVSFDGPAVDTTSEAQRDRTVDTSIKTDIAFDLDVTVAGPTWITGVSAQRLADGGTVHDVSDVAIVNGVLDLDRGGIRYDQLVRVTGTLRVADKEWSSTGSGLRVRRRGVLNMTELTGVSWQSAVFPSGRAFRYAAVLPSDHRESFVFDGVQLLAARALEVPWMTRLVPAGEDVSFVLESELGRHEITAETVYSFFAPEGQPVPTEGVGNATASTLHYQFAGVRYTWDGEEAYGAMERVSAPERVET